ncbi:transcriptional antiterminator Rof [Ectopseudomonas mendocina DLHK]|uniref:Rho-binding antiterminator n=1 Tax=Ectopseudomonas hydrolytica TaxID=2493633 RepID=UPI000278665A|nr:MULTISPECIES: Rho-binding antiterminator [unclassified Pseudomonas]ARS48369.1 transcriptional antiterminator [Pseudomonas mendocina]EJO93614.1 transcriptional antiterminator Rof [Pseudomonas mendocina DLHK]ATH82882.1 transcriptional antiterminator [Pseudomonas mendocina]MBA4243032.1 allophanate hydrolase [Pseudomonas sp.]UTH38161.1 Rho-binding antiterminator [Pseudomonas sp. KHPS1]
MDDYQPLACDLYDYLEIACLHRYRLDIELTDGTHMQGQALNTETTASKEEFLLVRTAEGEQRLRMDRLLAITPQDPGASFGRVLLSGNRC